MFTNKLIDTTKAAAAAGVPAPPAPPHDEVEEDEFEGSLDKLGDPEPAQSVASYGTKLRIRGAGANSVPVICLEPRVHHTFRYQRNDAGNFYSATVGDVARALVAAATTTTYRYIMRTFRIKRVTVRGSTGAIGTASTCSLRFLGANTNEMRYQDATLKPDDNCMVSRAPPRMSLASFWHDVESSTLSDALFEVEYFGTGFLFVDVALEFLIDVDRYVSFTLSGGTGLNLGGLYKGALANGLVATGGERL